MDKAAWPLVAAGELESHEETSSQAVPIKPPKLQLDLSICSHPCSALQAT